MLFRSDEYDALYAKQQASMDMPNFVDIIAPKPEPIVVVKEIPPHVSKSELPPLPKKEKPTTPPTPTTAPTATGEKSTSPNLQVILAVVKKGTIVYHKAFGDGEVTFLAHI